MFDSSSLSMPNKLKPLTSGQLLLQALNEAWDFLEAKVRHFAKGESSDSSHNQGGVGQCKKKRKKRKMD